MASDEDEQFTSASSQRWCDADITAGTRPPKRSPPPTAASIGAEPEVSVPS
jgi:hypothetical protein